MKKPESTLKGAYKRTHVYETVDHHRPKYLFTVIGDLVEEFMETMQAPAMIDVGGASGAFSIYMKQRFNHGVVTSLDFDPILCERGRQEIADICFIEGDANTMEMLSSGSFDLVTMIGTLSIFDDFRPSLSECLRIARPGARVIVVGQFNDHPVDALIRYAYSGDPERQEWNTGYNLFSKKTVSTFLNKSPHVAGHTYTPFTLPFDLAPQKDPIRTWTEKNQDGRRELKNGLNMTINLQLLDIVTQ